MEAKQKILNTLENFGEFILELKDRKDKINSELSRLDGKVNDLLHYMEGVCEEGVKVHPMTISSELTTVLQERRVIKDEYEILQSVLSYGQIINVKTINKMITKVKGAPKHYNMRSYSKDFRELKENKSEVE